MMDEFRLRIVEVLTKSDEFAESIDNNYSYSTKFTYYIIGFFGAILAFIFTHILLGNLKDQKCEILFGWLILGSAIFLNFCILWWQTWDSAKLTQTLIAKKHLFDTLLFKFDQFSNDNPQIKEMTLSKLIPWLCDHDKDFKKKFQEFELCNTKLGSWQSSKLHKIVRCLANITVLLGLLYCLVIGGMFIFF